MLRRLALAAWLTQAGHQQDDFALGWNRMAERCNVFAQRLREGRLDLKARQRCAGAMRDVLAHPLMRER